MVNKPRSVHYSLAELAEKIGAQLILREGSPVTAQQPIVGLATLQSATVEHISFLSNPRYLSQLQSARAAAVIVDAETVVNCPVNCLLHDDPYLAFAKLSQCFAAPSGVAVGIHPRALVSDSAELAEGVSIAAGVVVMDDVELGENCTIGANCVLEAGVRLGDNVELRANVTLARGVSISDDCRIDSGAVIGSDGFGYAPQGAEEGFRWQRIAQLGSVRIGRRVEIGANTTIDRGALDDTVIEDDVIIDNQVQIAHNVTIGRGSAIAGCVGVAGSTHIGRYCRLGGGVGVTGHLKIADGVTVAAMTCVSRSIEKSGGYASAGIVQEVSQWRRNALRATQLEKMNRRLSDLEKNRDNK